MSAHTILWFDNDAEYIEPFVLGLRREGFDVATASSLSEADNRLVANRYDLLILDGMISTLNEEEEAKYTPEATERGIATGPHYFAKWKDRLNAEGTKVLALTVRLDRKIEDNFLSAGLPPPCFARKVELRKFPDFLRKVVEVLQMTN